MYVKFAMIFTYSSVQERTVRPVCLQEKKGGGDTPSGRRRRLRLRRTTTERTAKGLKVSSHFIEIPCAYSLLLLHLRLSSSPLPRTRSNVAQRVKLTRALRKNQ